MSPSFEEVAALVRSQEIGRGTRVETPWGRRLLTYADLAGSGRYLHFVEKWLARVRCYYANSHTAVSTTGRAMTELREQARQVIAKAVNAGPDDVVMFVGSGATAAINKLVGLLGLRISEPLERAYQLRRHIPEAERPVVLIGPYEHHSNQLPWLESVAEVVEVDLDGEGGIDLADLERKLCRYAERPLRIGAFSAASNVTGAITDVRPLARMLHRHGALACFDFAAAGPYIPIDMNPGDPEARLDAIFLSPHKLAGGAGGSGVLVAHRSLFRSRTPERPGGGTVDYVALFGQHAVDYVSRLDEREEGGTPAILGDLRAAAGFVVRDMFGAARILEHDLAVARRALDRLAACPGVRILGSTENPRLAIISFNIDGLHHGFVSTLLDHLFGIQCRSGCSCAGPYGHRLLAIDESTSEQYRAQIAQGRLGLKPGWVRVSLPYYASEDDLDFILSAIELVARRGRDFLPAYRFSWKDGVWNPVEASDPDPPALELSVGSLRAAALDPGAPHAEEPVSDAALREQRAACFHDARRLADRLAEAPVERSTGRSPFEPQADALVWFDWVHAA